MEHVCDQVENIRHMRSTLERIEKAQELDRVDRKESERYLISVLEKVADQGARINYLETTMTDNNKDLDKLIEDVNKFNHLYSILTNKHTKYLVSCLCGCTILNFVLNILDHSGLILGWVKIFFKIYIGSWG